MHIDFSDDGEWIVSNCTGREILYWNAATGKQDRDALSKRDINWAMTTCVFGWATQGVWRPSTEEEMLAVDYGQSTDNQANWIGTLRGINAKQKTAAFNRDAPAVKTKKVPPRRIASVCRSSSGNLLVAADDRQRVALYRHPALPNSTPRLYAGHGVAATSVCFSVNDEHVVSAGGADCTILVWKHNTSGLPTKKKKKKIKSDDHPDEPTYGIEEAWLLLEDQKGDSLLENVTAKETLAWKYLEDDKATAPPKELGLPDLSGEKPIFKPIKPPRNTKPKPKPPPRPKKVEQVENSEDPAGNEHAPGFGETAAITKDKPGPNQTQTAENINKSEGLSYVQPKKEGNESPVAAEISNEPKDVESTDMADTETKAENSETAPDANVESKPTLAEENAEMPNVDDLPSTSTSESTDDQTKSGVGNVEIQDPKPQAGEESPAEQSEEKAPETSGGMGKNEEKVEVN